MADTLLQIVIERLGSIVWEEIATFHGAGHLKDRLSGKLTAICAVLKDAEERQVTSHVVKDWLQDLRDVAHVLDDILDECSIASKAMGDNKCITRFSPAKILARCDIGKRMKEVAEKIDAIAEKRNEFGFHAGIMERQPEDDEWRKTTSVITELEVYERDQDKERVVEFLLRRARDNEELSVYSIVGQGGYGKTTLAQLVFNNERVRNHFDLRIWVCVSDDFSMTKILQAIIEFITEKKSDLEFLESMQKKVQQILQSKRYLLVLDDVWNEDPEEWNKLKCLLQRGNRTKGASILVTTRLATVASIMGTCRAHHLGGLSEDDTWSIFQHQAFGQAKEGPPELEAIGKEIVRKCVGSPLAAKVLGSLLLFKSEEHWLSVKNSKFWDLPEDNRVKSALRLSYFNMKLSLRPCFSFCAIFPKDFVMVKENLIHLWMANGFISSRRNLEVEHVGNKVWNELYQRSFFEEVKTDKKGNTTFKMHDLVHDLAESIMGDECVVSNAASLTKLSSRVHHIGLLDDNRRFDYHKLPFKKVESLRTFLEFNPPEEENYHALLPITPLRAFRTSYSQLSALKSLTHLRYLELYCSHTTTLPGSVCRLQKLQILKLKDCPYLSSLPQQLTQLQDLRHLVIKNCTSLVSMPPKIGELTCLKTLSIFIVDSKTGFGLAELHDLQLGGKLHIKGLENVPNERDAREANLIGKKELNRLFLSWGGYANSQGSNIDAERVLEALEPHSGLISFGMKGYRGIHFPHWMRNSSIVKGLVDVILYDCKNCERLPTLGKLPCLTTLILSGMRDVKYIDDDLYEPATEKAFVSLKELTLRGLPNLEGILEAEGVEMLPQLSNLSISGVPKLAIPSLPSVEFVDCNGDVASFLGGIVCMHNLKELHIYSFNKIKVLPDELSTLSALEELDIGHCGELESLSEHMLQGLSSLRTLTIYHCQKFKYLSEGMGHLTCLELLVILDCPQCVLPSNMDRLTALRKVYIAGMDKNGMLPEGLESIPSLQTLVLQRVPSLPDWLGAMTSLQKLWILSCPELSSLPDSFQQLSNLHELHISGCPKLQKACEERTGKDWPKIAHIRDRNVDAEPEPSQPTFWDKMISPWKMLKIRFPHRRSAYTAADEAADEFDEMVDEL